MSDGYRIEKDTMGEMRVPESALYGASTARAVDNFPIAHEPVPAVVIHAFGRLKAACAEANLALGKLDERRAAAIVEAANEVASGEHDDHFPVDVYQTGSGTSTNMNANEVIANLANQKLGLGLGAKGAEDAVHPNDHVNDGQSSNDTFPTAMHIAAACEIHGSLIPALDRLCEALDAKAEAWDAIVKIGRTHLMDATPIRVGQVFGGYAAQARFSATRAGRALARLLENLPIGGTAVGTGINTHPEFAAKVCDSLHAATGLDFEEAANHPEAQAAKDSFVEAHGELKAIAVALSKIANDIRLLGSGPRCSIFELTLPATQPGSSIMPGKVNPVICESMMQVVCRVVGNDSAVTMAGMGGVGSLFELNVAMPVMIDAFMESVKLLANASNVFVDKLLDGLEVNEERCRELIDQSLMMVTSLAPLVGYEKSAALAKEAFASGKTIRELCLEQKVLPPEELEAALEPTSMTRPHA
ncbi:Fumarate hydratase class II [Pseudobythopirellula maris]|uniref:Fumarate hydratase class II n=1 Tax=Pseudobythopirellula maris TaxID=2527991 RepID=A0A5C5ZNN3_9BACT|nr:class II fumarate hydratase [Pseudobythopirellula maris]TWT88800.1 Fumarate hydratase class II [Pseudobythopirellula maris]